ncbi:MAG: SUMF1/EgtB/PvdO family nonheme iron enzyme [Planctomycetota bacterium]
MVPYTAKIPGSDVSFEMIPVEGGVVRVGEVGGEIEDAELPTSSEVLVRVEPRWVGKYEVTWDEYWQYMALDTTFAQLKQLREAVAMSKGTEKPIEPRLKKFPKLWNALSATPSHVDGVTSPTPLYDPSTTYESGEEPRLPAVTMSPYAARQYTKWLSVITGNDYRLPSEAEWEHAARAGGEGPYGTAADGSTIATDKLGDFAWTANNSDYASQEVGQKPANAWGLYDVLGNVAEWVLDEPRDEPNKPTASDKAIDWAKAVAWPTQAYPRIAKGGFWDAAPADCRIASRLVSDDEEWKASDPNYPLSPWWFTESPADGVGFRLVRPLKPMDEETRRLAWETGNEEIRDAVDTRLEEGRGKLQTIDEDLPAAIEELNSPNVQKILN